MFALWRGSTLPKLKEDISRGYVHHHCIEWFKSPCTEGIIYKDMSHSYNQDLMGGALF